MKRLLVLVMLLAWGTGEALAPDPDRRGRLDYRLFLGNLDGTENATALSDDSQHFSVGFGASSPVGRSGVLEANLEAWLTERAYAGPFPAVADGAVLTSASLSYGLRLRPARGPWLPYATGGLGFQASRLRSTGALAASDALREEIMSPTMVIGCGIEWRRGHESYGIDYRRAFTQGDFRAFGIEGAQLGGEFIGISLGSTW